MVGTRHTGRLSEELANTRTQLGDRLLLLRRDLDQNKLWKVVWNTSKPVIAAYLAKELAEKVKTPSSRTA